MEYPLSSWKNNLDNYIVHLHTAIDYGTLITSIWIAILHFFFFFQILIDTAQKRQALGEIEARHQEILHLEENIKVRTVDGGV